jgi:hypothetical protein
MNKDLLTIAMGLSEKDIKELMRLKKDGSKKLGELRRERKKLLTALKKINDQIVSYGGEDIFNMDSPATKRRGRKPGKKSTLAEKAPTSKRKKPTKANSGAKGKRLISGGLTDAVRKVLVDANDSLRAADIVDKLPGFGYKVKDVAAIRKRVSIVLATQKKNFEQVGRGLYRIVE